VHHLSETINSKDKKYQVVITFVFLVFIIKQITLLNYLRWEDEFDSILTNKMMRSGLKLYEQIYNPHGPFPFVIGKILEQVKDFSFTEYRILILVLQIIAIVFVIYSPIVKNNFDRLVILITLTTLLSIWMVELYSQTFTYQNIAGLSLLIIITRLTIPIWILKQQVSRPILFICSILLTNLFFLSFAYLPIILVLLYLSFPKKEIKIFLLGLSLPFVINTGFVLLFGSFSGFLRQHFYVNIFILPRYYPNQSIFDFPLNIYRSLGERFWPISVLTLLVIWIINKKYQIKKIEIIVFLIGIMSLLIRGVNFQALPFYYLWLGMLTILLIQFSKNSILRVVTLLIVTVSIIFQVMSLRQAQRIENLVPDTTDFAQLAEIVTQKDDKVFAYTYANSQYVLAKRLPSVADFYYLPMQFDLYAGDRDNVDQVCQQLKNNPPKIGYFIKYNFSEIKPWDSYASCINKFTQDFYYNLTFPNLLIRKDLLISSPDRGNSTQKIEMIASPKLKKNQYYNVETINNDDTAKIKIDGIGILFATYQSEINGDILLEIESEAGEVEVLNLNNMSIVDNRYTFVDLKPNYYKSFRIYSDQDHDLSVWQISNTEDIQSCVVTRYVNGKFKFTFGCNPF
jgi:hypothetical protein